MADIDFSDIVEQLEQKQSERSLLIAHLMEVERSEKAKFALDYAFNMHSINPKQFLYLDDKKTAEVDEQLTELLSAVTSDDTGAIREAASQITDTLDF